METKHLQSTEKDDLECEKWWTFVLLMFVGGFFGAFTYSIRGGVFCNAQTANFVLSAVALGNGRWSEFLYYFIPMTAYFLGAFISESVPNYIKGHLHIRWDTLFLLIEMLVVIFLAMLPESAPYRITQVLINLVASMQYNTFRQTQHIPMATAFCTNDALPLPDAALFCGGRNNGGSAVQVFAGKGAPVHTASARISICGLTPGGYSFRKGPPCPQTSWTLNCGALQSCVCLPDS